MPSLLTVEQVQAKADAQDKRIRVISYAGQDKTAHAQCLHCGDPISCPGGTLIDPRSPFAGCKRCGKQSRDAAKKKYTVQLMHDRVREHFGGLITIQRVTEETTINDDVEASCSRHGDLGTVPIRNLVDPERKHSPCPGCYNPLRGQPAVEWEPTKEAMRNVLPDTTIICDDTYTKRGSKMLLRCTVPGHRKHPDNSAFDGFFMMTPKQVIHQQQGCRDCGYVKVGEKKRIPPATVLAQMNEAQQGHLSFPNFEEEYGGPGTGVDTKITCVCENGHTHPKTVDSIRSGTSCKICTTNRSKTEVELMFELGQFDPTWRIEDTQNELVERYLDGMVDGIFFDRSVILEDDSEYYHGIKEDRHERDAVKTEINEATGKTVYRIREGNLRRVCQNEIRVPSGATTKQKADAVITRWIADDLLERTPEVTRYLDADDCNRTAQARRYYNDNCTIEKESIAPESP